MFPAPSPTPQPQPHAEAEQLTRELANELMSPYCPGRTISSCPSEQARKLEDWILERAEAGQSKQEIEQTLVARFGEEKLGSRDDPTVLYVSVAAALVAGFVIVRAARRWLTAPKKPPRVDAGAPAGEPSAGPGPTPTRAELDGVEDALDELEEF